MKWESAELLAKRHVRRYPGPGSGLLKNAMAEIERLRDWQRRAVEWMSKLEMRRPGILRNYDEHEGARLALVKEAEEK